MSKQPSDPVVEKRAEEAGETGFPPPELIYTENHRVMRALSSAAIAISASC